MALNRFMLNTVLASAAGSIDINATAEQAEVYSDGTDLTLYAGQFIRALDSGGKTCWGILTDIQGPSGADWVEVCSLPGYEDMTFNEVETGFTEGTLTSLSIMITDRPYRDMSGEPVKEVIRTPFDGGYSQQRPRFTRGREKFTLEWRFQSVADFVTFKDLFLSYAGSMFFMSHPVTHLGMICTFSEDSFRWTPLKSDVISVTCLFEEV